jgi:hypothetical protein
MPWLGAFAGMVVLAFLPTIAASRVVVHDAASLESDKRIQQVAREYRAVASANIVFEKCAAEYPTIAEDAAFLGTYWQAVSDRYANAYQAAYLERVGYPPDAPLVNEYVARIRALQQNAVNKTAATIQNNGCRDFSIRPIVTYIHDKHRAAMATHEGSQP